MNSILKTIILIISCCLTFTTTNAQGNRSPVDDVIASMKNNRGQGIGRYFDNFVPITINSTQSNYSHNQAELVLKDFFDKNPPKDFTVVNSGAPDANSRFAIATFITPNGKYNLYILMRQKDNSFVVKEIRITKD